MRLSLLVEGDGNYCLLDGLREGVICRFLTCVSRVIFLSRTIFVNKFVTGLCSHIVRGGRSLTCYICCFIMFSRNLSHVTGLLSRLLGDRRISRNSVLLMGSYVAVLIGKDVRVNARAGTS